MRLANEERSVLIQKFRAATKPVIIIAFALVGMGNCSTSEYTLYSGSFRFFDSTLFVTDDGKYYDLSLSSKSVRQMFSKLIKKADKSKPLCAHIDFLGKLSYNESKKIHSGQSLDVFKIEKISIIDC